MTKSTDAKTLRASRLAAIEDMLPDSTPDRRETLLARYEKGKTGPGMKRIDRELRDAGLGR